MSSSHSVRSIKGSSRFSFSSPSLPTFLFSFSNILSCLDLLFFFFVFSFLRFWLLIHAQQLFKIFCSFLFFFVDLFVLCLLFFSLSSLSVVAIGDGAVGKTALLHCYAHNVFPDSYTPTVFDNYSCLLLYQGKPLQLNLWGKSRRERARLKGKRNSLLHCPVVLRSSLELFKVTTLLCFFPTSLVLSSFSSFSSPFFLNRLLPMFPACLSVYFSVVLLLFQILQGRRIMINCVLSLILALMSSCSCTWSSARTLSPTSNRNGFLSCAFMPRKSLLSLSRRSSTCARTATTWSPLLHRSISFCTWSAVPRVSRWRRKLAPVLSLNVPLWRKRTWSKHLKESFLLAPNDKRKLLLLLLHNERTTQAFHSLVCSLACARPPLHLTNGFLIHYHHYHFFFIVSLFLHTPFLTSSSL